MKKGITVSAILFTCLTLAACGNNSHSSKSSNSTSSVSSHQVTKASTSSSSSNTDSSSASSQSASSSVHLTGGQSSIDYITQKMGDQGWTIQGGTYGGAHGAPTDGSYVPYNTVQNSDGDTYYVYQDGRIEKQAD